MSEQSYNKVQEEIKSILLSLNERERALLSAVVRIERDYLHIKQPPLKSELLKKVRELSR